MPTTSFAIESYLDEMELKYFTSEGENPSWIVLFEANVGVALQLSEDGEYLLMRSLPLMDPKLLPAEKLGKLLDSLMRRNSTLKVGHFGMDDVVFVEAAIGIEDGELTYDQFRRPFYCTVKEATTFKAKLPEYLGEEAEEKADSFDLLIQRLIHSDDSSDADSESDE